MKKITLYLMVFLATPIIGLSQSGIDIRFDSDGATGPNPVSGPNLAGGVYSANLFPSSDELVGGFHYVHLIVTNNSGADKQLSIVRKKISVPASWTDQVCWPQGCYNASGDVFTTPNSSGNPAPTLVNGTSTTVAGDIAELKPTIKPDLDNAGYGLYRYYINDVENGIYLDSVDVSIGFVLGFVQSKPVNIFSVSPNPADDFTNITLGYDGTATAKIVDALGNIVRGETIYNGSKSLDVSDLKNGVYFIMIESSGNKPLNRKLIVRH